MLQRSHLIDEDDEAQIAALAELEGKNPQTAVRDAHREALAISKVTDLNRKRYKVKCDAKEKAIELRGRVIKRLLEEGYSQQAIARELGVSQPLISSIASQAGIKSKRGLSKPTPALSIKRSLIKALKGEPLLKGNPEAILKALGEPCKPASPSPSLPSFSLLNAA